MSSNSLGEKIDALKNTASELQEAASEHLEAASEHLENASEFVKDKLDGVDLSGISDNVGNAVSGASEQIGETLQNVDVGAIGENVGNAVSGASEQIGETLQNVDVGAIGENVGNAVSGASEQIGETLQNVDVGAIGENIGNAVSGVGEQIGDALDGIDMSGVAAGAAVAGEHLQNLGDNLGDTLQNVDLSGAKQTLDALLQSDLVEKIIDLVTSLEFDILRDSFQTLGLLFQRLPTPAFNIPNISFTIPFKIISFELPDFDVFNVDFTIPDWFYTFAAGVFGGFLILLVLLTYWWTYKFTKQLDGMTSGRRKDRVTWSTLKEKYKKKTMFVIVSIQLLLTAYLNVSTFVVSVFAGEYNDNANLGLIKFFCTMLLLTVCLPFPVFLYIMVQKSKPRGSTRYETKRYNKTGELVEYSDEMFQDDIKNLKEQRDNPFSKVYYGYEREFAYYKVVTLFVKALFVIWLVALKPGIGNALITFLTAAFILGFSLKTAPYAEDVADTMENSARFTVTISCFIALFFMDSSDGNTSAKKVGGFLAFMTACNILVQVTGVACRNETVRGKVKNWIGFVQMSDRNLKWDLHYHLNSYIWQKWWTDAVSKADKHAGNRLEEICWQAQDQGLAKIRHHVMSLKNPAIMAAMEAAVLEIEGPDCWYPGKLLNGDHLPLLDGKLIKDQICSPYDVKGTFEDPPFFGKGQACDGFGTAYVNPFPLEVRMTLDAWELKTEKFVSIGLPGDDHETGMGKKFPEQAKQELLDFVHYNTKNPIVKERRHSRRALRALGDVEADLTVKWRCQATKMYHVPDGQRRTRQADGTTKTEQLYSDIEVFLNFTVGKLVLADHYGKYKKGDDRIDDRIYHGFAFELEMLDGSGSAMKPRTGQVFNVSDEEMTLDVVQANIMDHSDLEQGEFLMNSFRTTKYKFDDDGKSCGADDIVTDREAEVMNRILQATKPGSAYILSTAQKQAGKEQQEAFMKQQLEQQEAMRKQQEMYAEQYRLQQEAMMKQQEAMMQGGQAQMMQGQQQMQGYAQPQQMMMQAQPQQHQMYQQVMSPPATPMMVQQPQMVAYAQPQQQPQMMVIQQQQPQMIVQQPQMIVQQAMQVVEKVVQAVVPNFAEVEKYDFKNLEATPMHHLTRLGMFLQQNCNILDSAVLKYESKIADNRSSGLAAFIKEEAILPCTFWWSIFTCPNMTSDEARSYLLQLENPNLQKIGLNEELLKFFTKFSQISSSKESTFWFVFWYDVWKHNKELEIFKKNAAYFDPESETAIAMWAITDKPADVIREELLKIFVSLKVDHMFVSRNLDLDKFGDKVIKVWREKILRRKTPLLQMLFDKIDTIRQDRQLEKIDPEKSKGQILGDRRGIDVLITWANRNKVTPWDDSDYYKSEDEDKKGKMSSNDPDVDVNTDGLADRAKNWFS